MSMSELHEQKLKEFLTKNLEHYKSKEYLMTIYPPEDTLDYRVFLEYMSQGFNRKRKHLMDLFNISKKDVTRYANKHHWTQESQKWEKEVIKEFIKFVHMPLFNNDFLQKKPFNPVWYIQEDESYIQYFTFLVYLYLNLNDKTPSQYPTKYHVYSQTQLSEIFQSCGFRMAAITLNSYSQTHNWISRIEEYRVHLKAKVFTTRAKTRIESCINNNDPDYELKRAVLKYMIKNYDEQCGEKVVEIMENENSNYNDLSHSFLEFISYLSSQINE